MEGEEGEAEIVKERSGVEWSGVEHVRVEGENRGRTEGTAAIVVVR